MRNRLIVRVAIGAAMCATAVGAQEPRVPETWRLYARDVLRELIAAPTTSEGDATPIAERVAERLRAAGIPAADVQVVGPTTTNRNLVARLRASRPTRRPILLLAHLDVVAARREDWSMDPFTLTERDGFLYGRGTQDVKGGAAQLVTVMARLAQERVTIDRDVILALTVGEETDLPYNGAQWLVRERRSLIDAEYVLNVDGGSGEADARGVPRAMTVQGAEKRFYSVALEATNPGGHSSLPRRDNAIYALAQALTRVAQVEFPARTNPITRAYFAASAALSAPALRPDLASLGRLPLDTAAAARASRADPGYNAMLRTTCVATQLSGGHAENALPQRARAVINCRLLPDEDADAVVARLRTAISDSTLTLTPLAEAGLAAATEMRQDLVDAVAVTARDVWGPLPVIPVMETGGTDGVHTRPAGLPTFGVSGFFIEAGENRMHGRDERVRARTYDEGAEFLFRLLRRLAASTP